MKKKTWAQLETFFKEFPGARAEGAADSEIAQVELALDCSFDRDYREFLRRYGSASVGWGSIYGIRPCSVLGVDTWSVLAMTRRFRTDGWPGVADWYVISGDGRGNPIGMDGRGRVWLSDHDVGDTPMLARSFEAYIRQLLASLDSQ